MGSGVPLAYLAGDGDVAAHEAAAVWARREGFRPWSLVLESGRVGYVAACLAAGDAFAAARAVVPVGRAPLVVEAARAVGVPVLSAEGLRHAG